VYTIADIYADPHFRARAMLQQVAHPTLGHTTQSGIVPRLSGTPGSIRHTGPNLGANGAEILRSELGMTPERIQQLADSGALQLPKN
jgi:crotonobetainyl-CoA:carnitine CoA-transferase CaiB-like acyl-CoA transferase